MEELKTKKIVRRVKKAASSPIPCGPVGGMAPVEMSTCGHSGCERTCRVRYVGPVTHIRDHHIIHAARGAANVWTAAIVAGLGVVLTGAIAYTAVQAESGVEQNRSNASLSREMTNINYRLTSIEQNLRSR